MDTDRKSTGLVSEQQVVEQERQESLERWDIEMKQHRGSQHYKGPLLPSVLLREAGYTATGSGARTPGRQPSSVTHGGKGVARTLGPALGLRKEQRKAARVEKKKRRSCQQQQQQRRQETQQEKKSGGEQTAHQSGAKRARPDEGAGRGQVTQRFQPCMAT